MTTDRSRAKKIVGAIYSAAADRLYEPLVVKGAFRVFGGDLNELVLDQGRRAVQEAAGGPILDMPVGTGYFTFEMAAHHPGLVVGVDIAEGMVRHARADALARGLGNLAAVQGDAHHLPFADASFQVVVCSNGLQVIPGLMPAARELHRVLAPGGTLYVSVVTLALGALMPQSSRAKLPTMLRSGDDVADALRAVGFPNVEVRKERLATLLNAEKAAGASAAASARGRCS